MSNIELLKDKIRTSPDIKDDARELLFQLLDRTENLTRAVLYVSGSHEKNTIHQAISYAVHNMTSTGWHTHLTEFTKEHGIQFEMDGFCGFPEDGDLRGHPIGYGVFLRPVRREDEMYWKAHRETALVLDANLNQIPVTPRPTLPTLDA